eukprot:SAG31_NODE_531_length_14413_cov_7.712659_9_plen_80_part_00
MHGDTFSISALHLAIKVPCFSNSGHKNEKVTSYLALGTTAQAAQHRGHERELAPPHCRPGSNALRPGREGAEHRAAEPR